MKYIKGRIVGPWRVFEGAMKIDAESIAEVGENLSPEGQVYDFGKCLVLPGFIDIHMHGLCEHIMLEKDAISAAASIELQYGTTAFLPTAASLTAAKYIEFGHNVRKAQKQMKGKGAKILGAHFEGPFVNPARKGGMDADYLRPMNVAECQEYIEKAGDVLKLMTLSPELENSEEVIRLLVKNGIVASLGHSLATEQDLERAIKAGLSHVCHLFNTFMRTSEIEAGVWQPGLVEAILTSGALNCEVICDMYHVKPPYVKLAAKALGPDHFIAITDSLPGAGFEPGEYDMADGRRFTTRGEVAKLVEDGTIVGSILTMNQAFGNLIEKCNFDPVLAVKFTATNPARVLGFDDRIGSIQAGKKADIAVLDGDYNCIATFVDGQMLYGN